MLGNWRRTCHTVESARRRLRKFSSKKDRTMDDLVPSMFYLATSHQIVFQSPLLRTEEHTESPHLGNCNLAPKHCDGSTKPTFLSRTNSCIKLRPITGIMNSLCVHGKMHGRESPSVKTSTKVVPIQHYRKQRPSRMLRGGMHLCVIGWLFMGKNGTYSEKRRKRKMDL